MKLRIAALAPIIVLELMAHTAFAKDPALLSLTMEHFRDTATVKDDPADATTAISTEKGFAEHKGPMRTVWNDEYLRSVIDKKTGQKSFQVHVLIIYGGRWRSYETVDYRTTSGPKSGPVTPIGKEMANCAVGDCLYTERIAFPVDEELLRRLAATDVPGKPTIWAFRLIAKTGPGYQGGLSSAEIAGFLAKVDEYTNALPVAKANATSASLKRDLGISGMPVAATVEQPNRAGILVFGVNSGSIAQQSGIIIGDILYEFDGRPIKALAELEDAVAACAVNSTVAIKLYRGTNDMAVSARF
jgi:PDZ domain